MTLTNEVTHRYVVNVHGVTVTGKCLKVATMTVTQLFVLTVTASQAVTGV